MTQRSKLIKDINSEHPLIKQITYDDVICNPIYLEKIQTLSLGDLIVLDITVHIEKINEYLIMEKLPTTLDCILIAFTDNKIKLNNGINIPIDKYPLKGYYRSHKNYKITTELFVNNCLELQLQNFDHLIFKQLSKSREERKEELKKLIQNYIYTCLLKRRSIEMRYQNHRTKKLKCYQNKINEDIIQK
jgi:hypothetical protein